MKNNDTPKNFKASSRQGDVYLVRLPDDFVVPEGLKEIPKYNGETILAFGEVTGHSHAIASDDVKLWELAGNMANNLLEVTKTVTLKHEEHTGIEILPGRYEVIRQREYTPEAVKFVAD